MNQNDLELTPHCYVIQQMRNDYAEKFNALRGCIARLPDNRHKTDLVENFRRFFDHVVQNIDRKETDIARCLSEIRTLNEQAEQNKAIIERLKMIIIKAYKHD